MLPALLFHACDRKTWHGPGTVLMHARTGWLGSQSPLLRDEVLWKRGSDPDGLESQKPSQKRVVAT